MARYPKGSGKKNEKKRSKLKIEPVSKKNDSKIEIEQPIQSKIETLKAIESEQSTDFESNIDRIQAEIASQTVQNIAQKAEIEQKIELKAPPETQSIQKNDSIEPIEKPFNEAEVRKTAKGYEPIVSMALSGVSTGAVYLLKDQRAQMPKEIEQPLTENLSIIAAILWPDVGGMSEREKMIMFAGFGCLSAIGDYSAHLMKVKSGGFDKELKNVSTDKAG